MFNYKVKHLKLINYFIILLITAFLSNSYAAGMNLEDYEGFQSFESTVSSHPDQYDFLEAWDTGPGQDVKIGPDGYIYLSTGASISIYDINGNFINEWTDDVHIGDINGFDFDSQGNLYAMESTANQVVKLDSQGNFVLAWEIGKSAVTNRIACDSQNNVYIIDYSLERILKFDSNGNFISSWDPPYGSSCLAINSQDFVYVAGQYIQKYDTNGSFIERWETPLTSDGRLDDPHGLAVDSLDALYVTEMGTPRVQKFDSDGVFITEFGSDGGQGQLNAPLGITVAANGLVYVIDAENGRIQIYTPQSMSTTITSTEYNAITKPKPKQDQPSLIKTIIIPIPVAIVLLGLLFLINRFIVKIEEESID